MNENHYHYPSINQDCRETALNEKFFECTLIHQKLDKLYILKYNCCTIETWLAQLYLIFIYKILDGE